MVTENHSKFRTLCPDWPQIPQVAAFTVLAADEEGNPVSFKGPAGGEGPEKAVLEAEVGEIHWIRQVHEADILALPREKAPIADGVFTQEVGVPCMVRTADCLPVLFTDVQGARVGAAHAGWRGLYAGILPAMVEKFGGGADVLAWIGPGIAQDSYEVGMDMQERFVALDERFGAAFKPGKPGKAYADLAEIARIQLQIAGVPAENISGGHWDTFREDQLHSFRRDGDAAGRMASVIVIRKS